MPDPNYKQQYIARIHKVQDYIEEHIGQPMSTEELAAAAGFSKYHFGRIFQAILNEPLAHYVTRIRMERAVFLLAHREDKNMTKIAYELGFSDSAVFSRAFKNYYHISPREYRKEYRTNCKEPFLLSEYNKDAARKERKANRFPITGKISIKNIPEQQIAYVRHTGTYETLAKEYPDLIDTLFRYAERQHLLVNQENSVLAMYHDNPEFGEETQFRTSLCLTVPKNILFQEDGPLGKMKLEGGRYAVGQFHIRQEEYADAWNYMYKEWLTGSGYVPRNCSPFERYVNPYGELQEVEIYVPIEPI
ncbi:MAG: GyrI-like domain-containing protein [bacterium]|nr:GyrI-like domain-containing protein [bacterium]